MLFMVCSRKVQDDHSGCQIFVQTLYTLAMSEVSQLRIGELARRTGVATDLLRAWERRYGLLAPTRTESGYRLYSTTDVRRVGRMRELLATGVSAAEAAREALSEPPAAAPAPLEGVPVELGEAIRRLDDAAAHAAFDRLLADFSLDAVLDGAVLPLLRELGEGLGEGRGLDRPGALRLTPRAGPAPRARTRLGPWQRPTRGAGGATPRSGTISAF